jgi:hypothetical protein
MCPIILYEFYHGHFKLYSSSFDCEIFVHSSFKLGCSKNMYNMMSHVHCVKFVMDHLLLPNMEIFIYL